MTSTHWHRLEFDSPERIAVEYTPIDGVLTALPAYSLATYPDGGLRSSVNDMARWVGAMMNGGQWRGARILEEATVEEMFSRQTPVTAEAEGEEVEQGVFWVDKQGLIGHSGGDPGASTMVALDPEKRVGIVFMMNTDASDLDAFHALVETLMGYGYERRSGE